MGRINWEATSGNVGPVTHYGMWEGAKCFSIFPSLLFSPGKYRIKSNLPGFRADLPEQPSLEEAQAFTERMLIRWAAKRNMLFKDSVTVSDAMAQAALDNAPEYSELGLNLSDVRIMIAAALNAREPRRC